MQMVQFKDYYRPQEYVENPKYYSVQQLKDEHEKYWRTKGGLNPEINDHNPDKLSPPSLKWVNSYKDGSFKMKHKEKLMKELSNCEANFNCHVDG